jgi:membrane dipeptidase
MTDRARTIHADLPVVDGHNDLPWEIRVRARGSLAAADPRRRLEGYHTDLPRMIEGGVGVQFWSVYVPAWANSPLAATHRQIDLVEEMTTLAPELTALATSADGARSIRGGGRIAGLVGAEGGHSIENSLEAIGALHSRGVRYMTLTHADTNDWADSATDEARHGGLTEFGVEVVGEMNRLGMLVDISHVSDATMRKAIEASRAPVIASHSSAFALAPHPRNITDEVIEMVAGGGGVVMVTFVPAFIVEKTALIALGMFDERRRLRAQFALEDEAGYAAAARERFGIAEAERGTVGDVVDHIEHIARIGGVDHVGIGGDFDGVETTPVGLEDVSCYPAITEELLARGWAETDIRQVLGENALRALSEAEAAAG